MDFPLYRRIPNTGNPSSDEVLNAFLAYVEEKNLVPYSTQEEAILELIEEKNVILNTPTGSGKIAGRDISPFPGVASGAAATSRNMLLPDIISRPQARQTRFEHLAATVHEVSPKDSPSRLHPRHRIRSIPRSPGFART